MQASLLSRSSFLQPNLRLRIGSPHLLLFLCLWPGSLVAHPIAQENTSASRIIAIILTLTQSIALSIHIVTLAYEVWTRQAEWPNLSANIKRILTSSRARSCAIVFLPVAWTAMLIVHFIILRTTSHREGQCKASEIDPDIAGIGVRTGLYGFGGLVSFMAVVGHFHAEPSPVAELSLLLWASLTSTMFNLVKGFHLDMSTSQRVLVAMILDGYVNCQAIVLAMKETLAYRWKTICSLVMQFLGIVGMFSALVSLKAHQTDNMENDACECLDVEWWGASNTCGRVSKTLWIYVSLQVISWIHTVVFALRNSPDYKRARQVKDDPKAPCALPNGTIAESVYDSIPATTSTIYITSMCGLLSSCISIETLLHQLGHQDLQLWKTWGQSAQIVATTWAGYRVTQVMFRMFSVESVKRRQISLKRCATGTLIPVLGCIDDWNAKDSFWTWIIFHFRRFFKNHPFGSLPPRRSSDHARFCTFDAAWKELSLDYRQWPNASDEAKGQLLLEGCKQGDETLVSNLLEEAAPVDYCDPDGKTGLRIAIDHGHEPTLCLLIKHGADCSFPDLSGTTPLHVCCEMGKKDFVQLLLPAGADVHARDKINGRTPLHIACHFGKADVATLLLIGRANANASDDKQRTPLHTAVRYGNDGMVDMLAPNADVNSRDKKGKTPLYLAARFERDDAAKALLSHGANPDIADSGRGFTPLHACARWERPFITRLLLQHGCSTTLLDKKEQKSALHIATNYGREKVVDHLLDTDCDMDLLDCMGRTALFWAAKDDRACTRKLLKKGASTAKGDRSLLQQLLEQYGMIKDEAEDLIEKGRNAEIELILSGKKP